MVYDDVSGQTDVPRGIGDDAKTAAAADAPLPAWQPDRGDGPQDDKPVDVIAHLKQVRQERQQEIDANTAAALSQQRRNAYDAMDKLYRSAEERGYEQVFELTDAYIPHERNTVSRWLPSIARLIAYGAVTTLTFAISLWYLIILIPASAALLIWVVLLIGGSETFLRPKTYLVKQEVPWIAPKPRNLMDRCEHVSSHRDECYHGTTVAVSVSTDHNVVICTGSELILRPVMDCDKSELDSIEPLLTT